MLILTRKVNQGIYILGGVPGLPDEMVIGDPNGAVCIRVLGVERDRVKIGITAPDDVIVLREEMLNKGNKGASQ